jgi:hypothetical protein
LFRDGRPKEPRQHCWPQVEQQWVGWKISPWMHVFWTQFFRPI